MNKIINVLEQRLNALYYDFNTNERFYNKNYYRFSPTEKDFQEKIKDSIYKELEYIKALINEMGLYYKWDIVKNRYLISNEEV